MSREAKKGKPTTAEPGTFQKIEVMRRRLERGEQLFHPQDPRHEHAYNQQIGPKHDTVSLRDLYEAVKEHEHSQYDDNCS